MKIERVSIMKFNENFIILELTGNNERDNWMIEKMSIAMSKKLCGHKPSEEQKTYRSLISKQLTSKLDDKDEIFYLRINSPNSTSNFIDIFLVRNDIVKTNLFFMSSLNMKKLNDTIYRICYELTNRYKDEKSISIALMKNIFCKNKKSSDGKNTLSNWMSVCKVLSSMEYAFEGKIKFVIYDNAKTGGDKTGSNKHSSIKNSLVRTKPKNIQSIISIANMLGYGNNIVNTSSFTVSDIPANLLNFGELLCEIVLSDGTMVPAVLSGAINALYHIKVDYTSFQVNTIPVAMTDDILDDKTFYLEATIEHPDAYLYTLNPNEFGEDSGFSFSEELAFQREGFFTNHNKIKIKISDRNTISGLKQLKILSSIHPDFPIKQRVLKSIDNELYIRNLINEYVASASSELALMNPINLILDGREVMIMGLKYFELNNVKPKIKEMVNSYKFHSIFIVRKYGDSGKKFLFTPLDTNKILPPRWFEYPETQIIMSFNTMIDTSKSFSLERKDVILENDTTPQFDIELGEMDDVEIKYCSDLSNLKPTMVDTGSTRVIVVGLLYYNDNKTVCDDIVDATNSLCGVTNSVTAIYSIMDGGEDYIFNALYIEGEKVSTIPFEPSKLAQVVIFNDAVDTLPPTLSLNKSIFNGED